MLTQLNIYLDWIHYNSSTICPDVPEYDAFTYQIVHACTCTHTCTHACMHTHTHTHTPYTHARTQTCTHTHTHTHTHMHTQKCQTWLPWLSGITFWSFHELQVHLNTCSFIVQDVVITRIETLTAKVDSLEEKYV